MCSWIKKINIVKVSILPKLIYGITIISLEIPMAFFTEEEKNNPNMYTEPQKTPKSQSDPRRNNKAGGITLPDFKLYYEPVIIKTVWY